MPLLRSRAIRLALVSFVIVACARPATRQTAPAPDAGVLGGARQLVVVRTPSWDSTAGTLQRYSRTRVDEPWRAEGIPIPVVVGRTGLAWGGNEFGGSPAEPQKREGDGRSPAGAFPLDTVFGFAPRTEVPWVRLPYVPLALGSECVDDGGSVHYNTVVDRATVPRVDWTSAEHMRAIEQYRLGVIVGYNAAPPRAGRGSCIFLHIWSGPSSTTAGCTAFDAAALEQLIRWLDPNARPMLVQLTEGAYAGRRSAWGLP